MKSSPLSSEIIGNVDRVSIDRNLAPNRICVIVEGWIAHPEQEFIDLYFETAGASRAIVKKVSRPDIVAEYSFMPHARNSGYCTTFEFNQAQPLMNPLSINVFATLKNGNRLTTTIQAHLSLEQSKIDISLSKAENQEEQTLRQIALRNFISSGASLVFAKTQKPKISIIIVTHNRAADTFACLSSVHVQAASNIEVIIVDNASTDNTPYLFRLIKNVQIIQNSENLHFLKGARQGATAAQGEILLFINNDTILLPNALQAVEESFINHPQLGVLGARLIHPTGLLQEAGGRVFADGSNQGIGVGEHPLTVKHLLQRRVHYCSGAFLATPRTLWERIGGFDLRFSPAYYEDLDYCFSVQELGFDVLVEPRIAVIHREGAISDNAPEARQLMLKNREKFRQKHLKQIEKLQKTADEILPPRVASKKNVLIIDDLLPNQSSGQGAPRSLGIVDALISAGYRVTYVALEDPSSTPDSRYALDRDKIKFISLSRGDALLEFLALHGASFGEIIVSRPQNMEEFNMLREKYPFCAENVRVTYDAEAIFALREIRKLQNVEKRKIEDREIERIVSIEILTVKHADQFWAVSDAEALEFSKRGLEPVHVLGFGTTMSNQENPFHKRQGMLFVGPTLNTDTPNGDGLLWFAEHVAPLLESALKSHSQSKRRSFLPWKNRNYEPPSVNLTHIGLNKLLHIPHPDLVRCLGLVEDLSPYYQNARIFIAPIRFGSGIPLKVIEAAAQGLPIAATSYVAQQLGWVHEEDLLIADSPDQFAQNVVRLLTDERLWSKLQKNALQKVRDTYTTEAFKEKILSLLGQSLP